MKIVKNNETNKVIYVADDIEFGIFENEEKYKITVSNGHFYSTAINEENFTVVEVQNVPSDFEYDKYIYTNDWEIDPNWSE